MTLYPAVPVEDSQLVATALQHHLTLATRNIRYIAQTGVAYVDPFRLRVRLPFEFRDQLSQLQPSPSTRVASAGSLQPRR